MEGTHGKLCTRLTDRLGCNNTYRLTYLHRLACRHICTVALCTDTVVGTTGKNGTDFHSVNRIALLVYTF